MDISARSNRAERLAYPVRELGGTDVIGRGRMLTAFSPCLSWFRDGRKRQPTRVGGHHSVPGPAHRGRPHGHIITILCGRRQLSLPWFDSVRVPAELGGGPQARVCLLLSSPRVDGSPCFVMSRGAPIRAQHGLYRDTLPSRSRAVGGSVLMPVQTHIY